MVPPAQTEAVPDIVPAVSALGEYVSTLHFGLTIRGSQLASADGASVTVQFLDVDREGRATRPPPSLSRLWIEPLFQPRLFGKSSPDSRRLSIDLVSVQSASAIQFLYIPLHHRGEDTRSTRTTPRTTEHVVDDSSIEPNSSRIASTFSGCILVKPRYPAFK